MHYIINLVFVVILIARFPGFVFCESSKLSEICKSAPTSAVVQYANSDPNLTSTATGDGEKKVENDSIAYRILRPKLDRFFSFTCEPPLFQESITDPYYVLLAVRKTDTLIDRGTVQLLVKERNTFRKCGRCKKYETYWYPVKSVEEFCSREENLKRSSENPATEDCTGYVSWRIVCLIIILNIIVIAIIAIAIMLVCKYQKSKKSKSFAILTNAKYEANNDYDDVIIPQDENSYEEPKNVDESQYTEILPENIENKEQPEYDYIGLNEASMSIMLLP